jgi:hypothetical protein
MKSEKETKRLLKMLNAEYNKFIKEFNQKIANASLTTQNIIDYRTQREVYIAKIQTLRWVLEE